VMAKLSYPLSARALYFFRRMSSPLLAFFLGLALVGFMNYEMEANAVVMALTKVTGFSAEFVLKMLFLKFVFPKFAVQTEIVQRQNVAMAIVVIGVLLA
jgi:uridine phosphorylase